MLSPFYYWENLGANNKVSFKGNTFKHVGNKETSFEGEFLNTETDTGNESERKVILYWGTLVRLSILSLVLLPGKHTCQGSVI